MAVLREIFGFRSVSDASRSRSRFLPHMQIRTLAVVLFPVILSACASNEVAQTQPGTSHGDQGKLDVSYTRDLPDGSTLKELPTEVTIVKRRTTENSVAAQIGMNIVSFALGGGVGVHGFSKDDLKGEKIEGLDDRQNISNPIPYRFIAELQDKVNAAIRGDSALRQKAPEEKLLVSGGSSRLIYENLSGKDKEHFRLKTELYVWAASKGFHFKLGRPKTVNCSETTHDLLTQDQWAANDYALVKTKLDATLHACENKVLAQLPALLND